MFKRIVRVRVRKFLDKSTVLNVRIMEFMNVVFVHVPKVFMDANVNVTLHRQQSNRKLNNAKSNERKTIFDTSFFVLDRDHRTFVLDEVNAFVVDVNVKRRQSG